MLEMRELDSAAVADVIDSVCAKETFADVTPIWDNKPYTEVRSLGCKKNCHNKLLTYRRDRFQ